MDILKVLRARILHSFPGITVEELEIRLNLARQLIENIKDK